MAFIHSSVGVLRRLVPLARCAFGLAHEVCRSVQQRCLSGVSTHLAGLTSVVVASFAGGMVGFIGGIVHGSPGCEQLQLPPCLLGSGRRYSVGQGTLNRFFAAHVLVLPAILMLSHFLFIRLRTAALLGDGVHLSRHL